MTDMPDFDATSTLMKDLGFTLEESRSTPQAFGSWFIRANANGKSLRVMWDGRERTLAIQEPSLCGQAGDWGDRWVAGTAYRHKPGELNEALRSFLNG